MGEGLKALDDRDEFGLNDQDEFYKEFQRIFCKTEVDAKRVVLTLQKACYESISYRIDFDHWIVEGKR